MVAFDYDQQDWGAQRVFADGELSGTWVPDKYIVHYGGNANFAGDPDRCFERGYREWPSVDAEMAVLRIYEQSHLSRGWRAIGYNYAVGQSGKKYRLRGENPSGATSGDYEHDGIPENAEGKAILWIGGGDQIPTPWALDAITEIYRDEPMLVIGHRDVKGTTSCPGSFLLDWIHNEKYKENGMPYEQFKNMIDALFVGRPDIFKGKPSYFYTKADEGGIYDVPNHPDWKSEDGKDGLWPAFTRLIGGEV